jgi:hypothetical protein
MHDDELQQSATMTDLLRRIIESDLQQLDPFFSSGAINSTITIPE